MGIVRGTILERVGEFGFKFAFVKVEGIEGTNGGGV